MAECVLKAFYIQDASDSYRYSKIWAATEEDAIQAHGGLAEVEFIIDEAGWREYQMHYGNDDVSEDICHGGFASMSQAPPWKPTKSDRPEGWAYEFGYPVEHLKTFT